MKPVRLEILIDDKTLQGLNSVKGNLGGMENFYKQILGQLKAELADLQQKMKATMEQGINTDKQAAEIQALTGVVNQLTDELERLTRTKKKSNATPVVGDDLAPKMNNIKMSMAQIARELPSLTMGPQMFFLAISNNLPILQDALVSARKEFDALTAKGVAAVPVWKQVAKAIVSPQAAIAIVITLLTVYGDEIFNFAKKALAGKVALLSLKEAQEKLNEEFNNESGNLAKTTASVKNLSEEYKALGNDMNAKKEFIKKNKDEFDDLNVSVNNVAEADNLLIDNTDAYIKAMSLRAEATALFNLQVKEQEEAIKKQREAEQRKNEGPTFGDKFKSAFSKALVGMGGFSGTQYDTSAITAEEARDQAVQALEDEAEAANTNATAYNNMRQAKLQEAAALLKANNIREKTEGKDPTGGSKTNYASELAEARLKAQQKLERMLIETMEDGLKKRQALAEQELREELARIDADEKAQLETLDKARKAGQKVDANAEKQVQTNAQQQRLAANNIFLQKTAENEKEWQEKSLQSWIAYYEKYGTYAQQRTAIIQKYALMMNNTTDENEKAMFGKQQEEALQSLDEKFGKSTKQMTDLFEDASKKSVSAIQDIIDKYEKLIDYQSNPESKITKEDLLSAGFTEKDLQNLENGAISIADVTKALKELKGELKGKSPFKTFSTDIKEAFDKIKNAKGDTAKIGEGISNIGQAVTGFTPALKQFGSDISTIFGVDDEKIQASIDAVDGLGNAATGIGQAMSGDLVGGAMKAVSGIATVFESLNTLFGADMAGYEKMKENYETLNDIWDELISKKQEYIEISYGEEAKKAGDEALELANKSIESWRTLGKERLKSGAGLFSHSIGREQQENMGRLEWTEVKQAIGLAGYNKITGNRMTGLFDLSLEQLEKLKTEAPTFWAKLDGDVREYLDNIIEGAERLEDIQEQVKQSLTQTSFENVEDSFWNTLLDMKSDADSWSEDLSKTLQKAILKANMGELLDKDLRTWYDKFAKANEDGIDMKEYEDLQSEYNDIVQKALKERNQMAEMFGWDLGQETANAVQSGRAGAVTTITEETAGRLEGIGNAQLDRMISVDNKMEKASDSLTAMADSMATVAENSEYLKRLDDIADNIQNMYSTGVKIKN